MTPRCEFRFHDGQRCQYPAGHVANPMSPSETHKWELWIDELVGAALRERDAAHEIALKKARADAMDAAAALFDKKDAEARAETYFVTQPYGGVREEHPSGYYLSAREAARAIRALLEEAGNG